MIVKIGSYDYSRFGGVDGTLRKVSASSHVDEGGEAHFKGRVALSKSYIGDDPTKFVIKPGMSVQAEIATGQKSLLDYLLKPVTDAVNRAFTER